MLSKKIQVITSDKQAKPFTSCLYGYSCMKIMSIPKATQSKYESLQITSRKKTTSDLNIASSICITKQNKKVCFKTLFATIKH